MLEHEVCCIVFTINENVTLLSRNNYSFVLNVFAQHYKFRFTWFSTVINSCMLFSFFFLTLPSQTRLQTFFTPTLFLLSGSPGCFIEFSSSFSSRHGDHQCDILFSFKNCSRKDPSFFADFRINPDSHSSTFIHQSILKVCHQNP